MALFFCIGNSRVLKFSLCSWMLLFMFFMLTAISSALNAPSLSGYKAMKGRRQRSNDPWIAQSLNSICDWAECRGWIGCNQMMKPPRQDPSTPENFRVLQARDVSQQRRMYLGTCYGYSPPGDPAPYDWCKEGPKKDECACFNMESLILRIGYREEGETHPQYDAPIGDLCESRITSTCITAAPPRPTKTATTTTTTTTTTLPPTTSVTGPMSTAAREPTEVSTGLLTTSTLTPPATAMTVPTAMTTTNHSATRVVPTGSDNVSITGAPSGDTMTSTPRSEEGSIGIDHFIIWPPVLVALVLICLLVALLRRRRRPRKISTRVSVGFSVVNTSESPTTPPPISNPSYEKQVSGNELERSGNFYCPPLETIPRTPNSCGRSRPTSPAQEGENAAAVLGHFNVAFTEGNYGIVNPDPDDVSDGKLASLHRSISPREARYSSCPEDGEYTTPVVSSTASRGSSNQSASRPVQRVSADGYEDAPVFSYATSAYETSQQNSNHLQNYATTDNPRERNARPGADLHYEAVSPASHSPKPTGDNVYAYATAVVYPPGLNTPGGPQIVNGNVYNVLQTPVNLKENDGEYSMLKRSVGGSDPTSPHVPIVSSNEYNKIAIPFQH